MPRFEMVGPTRAVRRARTALQITAVLCTLELLFQGTTAGEILNGSEAVVSVHGGGAIVFHVLSLLMLIAAFLLWRATGGHVWTVVISAAVFVIGLAQAYVGDRGVLSVHVPLAIALTLATAWVLAWSFLTGRTARRRV
jgi:hypothetical protein